ncbi:spore germination protein [Gracilibacillus sp. YIM 98692]|uniref:spore germination protein n=1 Tax=Gracilibacillus sp. YIM 98692 TaxID=2663532 RepID=UPI0013D811F2|nr:spore germination protein [Gracilibacillus sp. YIM 98692]
MPAVVGAVKVINIGSSSIFHIGDVYKMQPYTQAKTFAGGGSFNTGDGIRIQLKNAQTQMIDDDKFDQNITGV